MPERAPTPDEHEVFVRADQEAQKLNRRLAPITTRRDHLLAAGAKFPARSRN